ncbi:MAG: alpha/beta hydrolase [Gammaproteobacteria bacterium]
MWDIKYKYLKLLILIFSLTGCHYYKFSNDPNDIALKANLNKQLNYTKKFIITSYSKSQKNFDINYPLFIYIEGDGQAWISRYRLSNNPTPKDPLTLKLAAIDPNPNVLYIARPCQFTDLKLDLNCHNKYWSESRYSIEVVDAINEVINNFKSSIIKNINNKKHKQFQLKIHLIGYSGGATIAGLVASMRDDILSIRTIAGNLDHDAASNFHQTTKLKNSLNLIDYIPKIKHIPQMHYIGEYDQIIPLNIIKNFVTKINQLNQANYFNKPLASYKIVKSLDHYRGWENFWQHAVTEIPS